MRTSQWTACVRVLALLSSQGPRPVRCTLPGLGPGLFFRDVAQPGQRACFGSKRPGVRIPPSRRADQESRRAHSSIGRAPLWQGGGSGFESRWVHADPLVGRAVRELAPPGATQYRLAAGFEGIGAWGCSSLGRALSSQGRGTGFESPHLHFPSSSTRAPVRDWRSGVQFLGGKPWSCS